MVKMLRDVGEVFDVTTVCVELDFLEDPHDKILGHCYIQSTRVKNSMAFFLTIASTKIHYRISNPYLLQVNSPIIGRYQWKIM